MRGPLVVVLFLTLAVLPAACQRLSLKSSEAVPIPGLPAGPISMPKCDADENLYFRYYPAAPTGGGAWVRVTASGKASRFGIPSDYPVEDILDSTPGRDGLYLLVQTFPSVKSAGGLNAPTAPTPEQEGRRRLEKLRTPQEFEIVSLDEHGEKKAAHKLEVDFFAHHFAVFNSGNFLLIGDRTDSAGDTSSVTAIVDPKGRVLKEITLSDDIRAKDAKLPSVLSDPQEPDERTKKQLRQQEFSLQLSRSPIQRGDDDRIYVARTDTATGPIYAIRESSEVERIAIRRPEPDARLISLQVSHGTMMLYYILPKKDPNVRVQPRIFSIWDLSTGKLTAEYLAEGPGLGAALGCYEPGKLRFLRATQERELELLTATPQ